MMGEKTNCIAAYEAMSQPYQREATSSGTSPGDEKARISASPSPASAASAKPFTNCGTMGISSPMPRMSRKSVTKMKPMPALRAEAMDEVHA
jgi:hypothetical protein